MTLFYPNHTITIYRNRRIGVSNRWGMSATFTPYQADIQPASLGRQQLVPEHSSAIFDAFVDSSDDVREGDQIRTEDGKLYSVKGVEKWEGGGVFGDIDHLYLLLTSLDA